MTRAEILAGLKGGRTLVVDRNDEPNLPWLLAHPQIEVERVEYDEQSSAYKFRWRRTKEEPKP